MTDKLLVIGRKELQSRRLPCRLTEDEKLERCKDLAGAVEQEAEAKAAWEMAKERAKTMKELADVATGRVQSISKVISSGTEMRSVDCRTILDYEKKVVVTQRVDTEAIVSVRNMTDAELQADLYEDGAPMDAKVLRVAVEEWFQRRGEDPREEPEPELE